MGTLASGSIDLNSLQVAGKPNKYITDIDENGITIHPELIETDSYYTIVNGNGLKINKVLNNVVDFTNDTTVAEFSANGTRIGSKDTSNISITESTLVGKVNGTVETFEFNANGGTIEIINNTTLLERTPCSDISIDVANPLVITADMLNDAIASSNVQIILHVYPNSTGSGEVRLYAEIFKKDGTTQQDTIDTYVDVPGELTHRYLYITYDGTKTISIYRSANFNYDSIKLSIEYFTIGNAPTFSFGGENTVTGGYSSVSGFQNKVTSNYSSASGFHNEAAGKFAHAEGGVSYAAGDYSHAEGHNTWATGKAAHSEGDRCDANGDYSHVHGYNNTANGEAQTVIGKYNNNNVNNAFEIGNGLGEGLEPYSNAFSVSWDGSILTEGTLTMENHTDPIGWYDSISDTVNKLTGTSFASISGSGYVPDAGRYLITASARFSGATSGNRGVCIYQNSNVVSSTQVLVPAIQSASWSTDLKTMGYFITDGSTEFKIGLLQNSGSSLSTSYTLTFIRIR